MSVHSLIRPATSDDEEPTCTLWYIRLQLGRGDFSDRRMVAYVRALIAGEGFPPPLPTLTRGGDLTHEVTPKSRWRRDAVDAWLADFLPPSNQGAIERAAMQVAAIDMDAAAGLLASTGPQRRTRLRAIEGGRA